MRYRLIDNSDFLNLFSPHYEIISHEVLFGYAFHLTPEVGFFDLHLGVYTGIGSVEEVNPHLIAHYGFFNDQYESVSRSSTCLPLELCFEIRFKYYIGFSYALYATYSRFSPVYGFRGNIIIGYW